ncbi:MAG: histidinol-phosphatase [Chloroflexota bacterium]|nr:histidinol-phosphatase [Chloroflexota bacterium]
MSPELAAALAAARAAGAILRRYYRRIPPVETKADRTPVTVADREAEEAIRRVLEPAIPGAGFLGEETGVTRPDAAIRWIVDPLDGTAKFIRKLPFFGPCIALEREGELILGVASLPMLGETFWAERGAGAFRNGRRIRVSAVDQLEHAYVVRGYERAFYERGLDGVLERLARMTYHNPGFLDLYSYLSIACGRVDAIVDHDEHLWDIAAHRVIIEEAGGRLTDFRGTPTIDADTTIASNGVLHEALLALVSGG